jgi:hypothetical protein
MIQIPIASVTLISPLALVANDRAVAARTPQPLNHAFQAAGASEAKSKTHGAASNNNALLSFARLMIVLFQFVRLIVTSVREGHRLLRHAAAFSSTLPG